MDEEKVCEEKKETNLTELEKKMGELVEASEDTEKKIRELFAQVEGKPIAPTEQGVDEKAVQKANRILRLSDKILYIRNRLHVINVNIGLLKGIIGE